MGEVSLQQRFMDSLGQPLEVLGLQVFQMDRIPWSRGTLTIEFLSPPKPYPQGIALKVDQGFILNSDGTQEKKLYVWDLPGIPRKVTYEIQSKKSEIKIWNTYQEPGKDLSSAAYWTNNAGMTLLRSQETQRTYRCSSGYGPFDPEDLIFSLRWEMA